MTHSNEGNKGADTLTRNKKRRNVIKTLFLLSLFALILTMSTSSVSATRISLSIIPEFPSPGDLLDAFFNAVYDAISSALSGIKQAMVDAFNSALHTFKQIPGQMLSNFRNAVNQIRLSVIRGIHQAIVTVRDTFLKIPYMIFEQAKSAIRTIMSTFLKIPKMIFEQAKSAIVTVRDTFLKIPNRIMALVKQLIASVNTSLKLFFEGIKIGLTYLPRTIWTYLREFYVGLRDSTYAWWQKNRVYIALISVFTCVVYIMYKNYQKNRETQWVDDSRTVSVRQVPRKDIKEDTKQTARGFAKSYAKTKTGGGK